MNEDTDAPVTDIIFVKDLDECPKDYKVINHCPCGHNAQLWENVVGDEDQERYIAYTKNDNDDKVVEDLMITDGGSRYLKPGFVVMRRTPNGDKVLRHRDVAVKKVNRAEANNVVLDVAVFRSKDKPSKLYRKIIKIKGLYVCVRVGPLQAKYKNRTKKTESTSVNTLSASKEPLESTYGTEMGDNSYDGNQTMQPPYQPPHCEPQSHSSHSSTNFGTPHTSTPLTTTAYPGENNYPNQPTPFNSVHSSSGGFQSYPPHPGFYNQPQSHTGYPPPQTGVVQNSMPSAPQYSHMVHQQGFPQPFGGPQPPYPVPSMSPYTSPWGNPPVPPNPQPPSNPNRPTYGFNI